MRRNPAWKLAFCFIVASILARGCAPSVEPSADTTSGWGTTIPGHQLIASHIEEDFQKMLRGWR